jgi:hypothetical protein
MRVADGGPRRRDREMTAHGASFRYLRELSAVSPCPLLRSSIASERITVSRRLPAFKEQRIANGEPQAATCSTRRRSTAESSVPTDSDRVPTGRGGPSAACPRVAQPCDLRPPAQRLRTVCSPTRQKERWRPQAIAQRVTAGGFAVVQESGEIPRARDQGSRRVSLVRDVRGPDWAGSDRNGGVTGGVPGWREVALRLGLAGSVRTGSGKPPGRLGPR